jgi:hypothetical protein
MAAKKMQGKNSNKPGSTSKMPKTKKNLGAQDAGQAQRIGGLKAAGQFFSGSNYKGGEPMTSTLASKRTNKLKGAMLKKSSGGMKSPKK